MMDEELVTDIKAMQLTSPDKVQERYKKIEATRKFFASKFILHDYMIQVPKDLSKDWY